MDVKRLRCSTRRRRGAFLWRWCLRSIGGECHYARRDAAIRTAKRRYRHIEARNERVGKIGWQGRKRL